MYDYRRASACRERLYHALKLFVHRRGINLSWQRHTTRDSLPHPRFSRENFSLLSNFFLVLSSSTSSPSSAFSNLFFVSFLSHSPERIPGYARHQMHGSSLLPYTRDACMHGFMHSYVPPPLSPSATPRARITITLSRLARETSLSPCTISLPRS